MEEKDLSVQLTLMNTAVRVVSERIITLNIQL